ncbi:class F sortase [Micrococcus luteus]
MSPIPPRRRGRLAASAAALCLLLAGCAGPETTPAAAPASASAPRTTSAPDPATASSSPSSGASSASREDDAAEYRAEAASSPAPEPSTEPEPVPEPSTPEVGVLPASTPVRVRVEKVGVDSTLMELGLQEDGTVEVPPTGEGTPAGWYRNSPTPGERGPAVLLGHVGNAHGRLGVFGRLKELVPGDVVEVDRADGSTAVFTVDRSVSYERSEFPTNEIYGNTDDAQLRLITCDSYSAWTGRWEANHVVYATLDG